ncbi:MULTISPECIES: DUF1203 domain-containing protein [Luteibacter]|uniref:DUF1203 domain-containing protein n=1 Tax=Luteibacter TaxID=242605 RepID=UPI00056620D6|nr:MULTISPECIES: DUF1203 domain-containing protein [unclassified Luteibacter]
MSFRISGLDPAPFQSLYGLDDRSLEARNALRVIAGDDTGYPERIELRAARKGEALILLNYVHQPAPGPYRASHAIFVREGATVAYDAVDEVPDVIRTRHISLRAFDERGHIADALLVPGTAVEEAVERLFNRGAVRYIHAHYAAYGCYAARIDRVG